MKKKLLIIVICFLCLNINVFAATDGISGTTSITESQRDASSENKSKWNELESNYKKGIITENITGTKYVLLYGKSVCNGSSCTNTYANSSSYTFKDVLSRSIKCSNGEKNINYQYIGGGKITTSSENTTAYWTEEYKVECTSTESGETVIKLNNDTNSSNSNSSSSSDDNSSNNSTTTDKTTQTNNSNYNSSSTVNNEKTGINTYFIVLALVAVISYIFMLCVKKYNLFKNI